MKQFLLSLSMSCCATIMVAQQSPNGKLTVHPQSHTLTVHFQNQPVLDIETVTEVSALRQCTATPIKADYQMLSGKKSHCTNEANEYRCGALTLCVYNDGIALRYDNANPNANFNVNDNVNDNAHRSTLNAQPSTLHAQPSTISYHIPEGTRRWMQQWTESYEGFFPLSNTAKVKPVPSFSGTFTSPEGYNNRWGFPALIEPADGIFALITEANIGKQQSASCLYNEGELFRVVPDTQHASPITPLDPQGRLPEQEHPTPWQVVIVGTLADIVESTLVTDVSEPCKLTDTDWIQPGVVSWVYWAYNHGSSDYQIIKKYVDMAAILHLPYVLIDAEWDEMRDGKTIEDAIAYAHSQGVRPMIWYNSSVGWIDGAPGPKFRLNNPEDREREFYWCEQIGVAGVKIDFFSGDNQMNMDYCQDLLECAARHHLLVNFHGATVPRGWQRTWPNLLSTEGVYGAEWYNNVPTFTAKAASHNATLPFTRNVIGPMDYTPCAFSDSQHPHITTHAHELALTVLFESGLQHLADRPESFLTQPQAVMDFLSQLPTAWDETHLVSGYPGQSVVLARRHGNSWYVAGINGTDEPSILSCNLHFMDSYQQATLFTDSGNAASPWHISSVNKLPDAVLCLPRGGFVFVIQ